MKKTLTGVLALSFVVFLAYFVFGLTQVTVISPLSNQNLSGTIVLNTTTDLNASNVTFGWVQGGNAVYNVTIPEDTSADTVSNITFNTTFDTSLLTDGIYNLTVNATNGSGTVAGNLSIENITIDNTPPNVVSIASPSGNSNLSTGSQIFNATVNDTTLQVSTVYFNVTNGGGSVLYAASNPGGDYWNATISLNTLAEGVHNATVEANDTLNNINNSEYVTFTVDRTGPNVTIVSPASGANLSTGTQVFNATVADTILSVSSVIFNITNASSFLLFTASNPSGNDWNVTVALGALGDGSHTATVIANDTLNNINNSESVTFTVDTTAPVVSIETVNNSNFSSTAPTLNFNFTDNVHAIASCAVYLDGSLNQTNSSTINATSTSMVLGGVPEGTRTYYFNCTDTVGNVGISDINSLVVDLTTPYVGGGATYIGPLGYGVLNGDTDDFYSKSAGNNLVNISVNITDTSTGVVNVTFNMTNICSGPLVAASLVSGIWYANCSVDQDVDFEYKNVTYTACDTAGNCNNTLYRSVFAYNFTYPDNATGTQGFDPVLSTNLGTEANLNTVNYLLGVALNGTRLPGQPWQNMQLAAYLNFSNINFTDSSVYSAMAALSTAISVTTRAPRNYGSSSIFVNTTAFEALNTGTIVTLYNLPFTNINAAFLTNETGGAGGLTFISAGANGDGTSNLTFNVSGFSAYNVSDTISPIITPAAPGNDSQATFFNFTATFNGTGTEIDNGSVNLTLTGTTTVYYNHSNMTCTIAGELLSCNITATPADGTYNYTIAVKDFGGASGNSASYSGVNITVDSTAPAVTSITAPISGQNLSIGSQDFNATVTDDTLGVSQVIFNISNGSTTLRASASKVGATNVYKATVTLTNLGEGAHTANVIANDSLGNTNSSESVTFTVDRTVPAVAIETADFNTTDNTPSLNFNFTDNVSKTASCTLYFNGTGYNTTTGVSNATSTTLTASSALPDNTYSATVNCTDASGNIGQSNAITIGLDTGAPGVSFVEPSDNEFKNETFTMQITASGGASTANYMLLNFSNTSQVITGWTAMNGSGTSWNVTINVSAIAEWKYVARINATDASGNQNATVNRTFGIDTTIPYNLTFSCSDITAGDSQSCTCTANDTSTVYGGNVNTTITTPSTASAGTNTPTCTATDAAGNANSTTTSYTVSAATVVASSGGGGTRRVSTGPTPTASQGFGWGTISAGQATTATITAPDSPVTQITFELDQQTNGASMDVAVYDEIPPNINDPLTGTFAIAGLGAVHSYIEIDAGLIGDRLVESTITFEVTQSWLNEQGMTMEDVVMLHYNDGTGEWEELPTSFMIRQNGVFTFTATTTSFSLFAIGVKGVVTAPPAEVTEEVTSEKGEITPPTGAEEAKKEVEEKIQKRGKLFFWIVLGVAVVVGIYFILGRKSGKRSKSK